MNKPKPFRLKDSPDLGNYLRTLDDQPLSEEQLAENAEQIKAAIAGGAGAAAGVSALSNLVRYGLPVLVGIAAASYLITQALSPATEELPPEAEQAAAGESQLEQEIVKPAVAPVPIESRAMPEEDAGLELDGERTRQPKPRRAAPLPQDLPIDSDPASDPPTSDLPEQLQIYNKAKWAGQRGDFSRALQLLDELLGRFPQTQLRAEAELARFDYLVRAGRTRQAIVAGRTLLSSSAHAARYGELLRVLGDLQRRQGDCAAARKAYQRALRFRLSDKDREAAQGGLELCRGQEK